MIIDPYGRILAETWKAADDMVVADLDASLLVESTGSRWIKTRRPELYGPLAVPTGKEQATRAVRFDGAQLRYARFDGAKTPDDFDLPAEAFPD